MKTTIKKQSGFTLIEMLIVIIILGILAMIIIPQIAVSTGDAKVNTLRANLSTVRNAIELYYHQHDSVYPGVILVDGSGPVMNAGQAQAALVAQLTTYTELSGNAAGDSATLTAPIFGPYLKTVALPENPFNISKLATCDITTTDVTARTAVPADATGWRYYVRTGVFIANDDLAHDDY